MPAIELPLLPSLLAACLVLVVGGFWLSECRS